MADGVFQNLGVKKLGDLPERNLQVKSGAPNLFEDAVTTIINAGNVAGRNGDEETADHFVNQKTDYKFIKISHS